MDPRAEQHLGYQLLLLESPGSWPPKAGPVLLYLI